MDRFDNFIDFFLDLTNKMIEEKKIARKSVIENLNVENLDNKEKSFN